MKRRRKRNYKFWDIVRSKSKRHYGKRSHGGLRIHGVSKKYQSKGHFDFLEYLRSNKEKKKPYRDYTFKSSKGKRYKIHTTKSKSSARKWFNMYRRDWGL